MECKNRQGAKHHPPSPYHTIHLHPSSLRPQIIKVQDPGSDDCSMGWGEGPAPNPGKDLVRAKRIRSPKKTPWVASPTGLGVLSVTKD